MRFTAALSATLALAASANAMGAADMVNNINDITDKSSQTNDIAESLSVTNVFQKAPVRPMPIPTEILGRSNPLAASHQRLQGHHPDCQQRHHRHERQA